MCQVFNQCRAESLCETMDVGQLSYTKLVLTPSRHPLPQRSSTSSMIAGAIMSTSFQNSFISLSSHCTVHLPSPSNFLHTLHVHAFTFFFRVQYFISFLLDVLITFFFISFFIQLYLFLVYIYIYIAFLRNQPFHEKIMPSRSK